MACIGSFVFQLISIIISFGSLYGYTKLDLTDSSWQISSDGHPDISVKSKVPGSVHTALYDSGLIPDPLYRDNDVKLAWVGRSNWAYKQVFTVNSNITSSKRIQLVCEGLDTIATISLNGTEVGHSDNMFVRKVIDVTDQVKAGKNYLEVYLKSPVQEALDRVNRSDYVIPPSCPSSVQNGECHVNQIRKEQCSFSWDWGPSFPTVGIWKPIYIEAFDTAVIRDVTAVVNKVASQWQVIVEVDFDVQGANDVKGLVTSNLSGLNLTSTQDVTLSASNNYVKFIISVPEIINVPLWWPNGYGSQPLFDLKVTLATASDVTEKTIRIGFRTVQLVQTYVSSKTDQGLTFYFKINGVPVFLKGSNWIPADSFQERITKDELRYLLESAANVSTNAMRVWGGGVYESNDFYELCDELGIMIWQDFMFSVALYPTYGEFIDSVSTEIKQQVWRLKPHPSIIVWAGNNENEAGLRQNWFGTNKDFMLYYIDYLVLYAKTIKLIIDAEDPTRDYLTSSPSNGQETVDEGYVAKDPGSEFYGDVHFYDYSVDQWNVKGFRIPRMASEYGVQAWCNNETLAKVFVASDYAMDSDMVNHRQHHGGGNSEMAAEVGLHINLPNSPDEKEKFVDFIYLTQINQAMCIRSQSEHYRRHQSKLLPDGRGLTMGALYWQLNDIWQAPTWASIDYSGTWKMLHYYAKSFFNNNLISPYYLDDNTVDVYIVIDEIAIKHVRDPVNGTITMQPMVQVSDYTGSEISSKDSPNYLQNAVRATTGYLRVDIYKYTSLNPLFSWNVSYSLTTTAESVFQKTVSDLLTESGCPGKEKCILRLTSSDSVGSPVSSTWFALAYPKYSVLPPAKVQITSVVKLDQFVFEIEISSDVVALYTWLSTDTIQGHFSDNGFPIFSATQKVLFYATDDVSASQLTSQLRVRSITDVKNNSTNNQVVG